MSRIFRRDLKPCRCGNQGHENLREWWSRLRHLPDDFAKDEIDLGEIEKQVHDLAPAGQIAGPYCIRCQDFINSWPRISLRLPTKAYRYQKRPHFQTTAELDAGYRSGCQLCVLFVQCISKKTSLQVIYKIEQRFKCLRKRFRIATEFEVSPNSKLMLYLAMADGGNMFSLMENLWVFSSEASGDPDVALSGPQDTSAQLELPRKWLKNCLNTHSNCKVATEHQLPTRLLDVYQKSVRLVTTTHWSSRPLYATLSHCWGKVDFLKLTAASLEAFSTLIAYESLTQSFKDAIVVTRELGLRYLWIDSLCIIQDSAQDWEIESALMSSVYRNSTINISATGAADGNAGLFLKPEGYAGKVQIRVTTSGEAKIWEIAPSIYMQSVTESPLAKRAWTVQERLLASRTIHFTQTELVWECKTLDACESFPRGLPEIGDGSVFNRGKEKISENWRTVVGIYTQANLTYDSDKLIAIAGIARAAQRENDDEYLAGLWRKGLEVQLSWSRNQPDRKPVPGDRQPDHKRPLSAPYRAPSWSWASVNGFVSLNQPVQSDLYYYEHFVHLVDASCTPLRPASSDTFGQLRGGYLNLGCAYMLSGKLLAILGPSGFPTYGLRFWPLSGMFLVDMDYFSDEDNGQLFYCLPLTAKRYFKKKGKSDKGSKLRAIEGLILRSGGTKKGEYCRVGRFSVSDDLNGVPDFHRELYFNSFVSKLKIRGAAGAESGCASIAKEPKNSNQRYLVTLI